MMDAAKVLKAYAAPKEPSWGASVKRAKTRNPTAVVEFATAMPSATEIVPRAIPECVPSRCVSSTQLTHVNRCAGSEHPQCCRKAEAFGGVRT